MENHDFSGLGLAVGLLVLAVAVLVALVVAGICLYLIYNAYKGVPQKHREIEPGQVFLLLIPCFNLYWAFRVFPSMMKGYKAALEEKGLAVEGDGGQEIAKWYCILTCCSLVPYLGILPGMAALVLWIMTLVKAYEHKRRLNA